MKLANKQEAFMENKCYFGMLMLHRKTEINNERISFVIASQFIKETIMTQYMKSYSNIIGNIDDNTFFLFTGYTIYSWCQNNETVRQPYSQQQVELNLIVINNLNTKFYPDQSTNT